MKEGGLVRIMDDFHQGVVAVVIEIEDEEYVTLRFPFGKQYPMDYIMSLVGSFHISTLEIIEKNS